MAVQVWYVDRSGAKVDPSTLVSGGVATADIYRLELTDAASRPTQTLWAAPGTPISSDMLDAAAAEQDAGDPPTQPLTPTSIGSLVETITGSAYTFVAADGSKIKLFDRATAQSATVPPSSDTDFPIGTQIELVQANTGTLTVVAGAGVTIHTAAVDLALGTRWERGRLTKIGTDSWVFETSASLSPAGLDFIPTSEKGAASGVATLDGGGKVPAAQIPAIGLSDFLGDVASQAAMLALTGQRGDWCRRTDLSPNQVFMLAAEDATQLSNWIDVTGPGAVVTVQGRSGTVTLDDLFAPLALTVRAVTATALAAFDQYIVADTSGGTFAVTAPAPTAGRKWAMRWQAGAVAPTLVGTFAGAPTFTATGQAMEFISDGTSWYRTIRPSLASLPDYPAITDARYVPMDLSIDSLTAGTHLGDVNGAAPAVGPHAIGDWAIDRSSTNPGIWICTTAGTPGLFQLVGGGGTSYTDVGNLGATHTFTNNAVPTDPYYRGLLNANHTATISLADGAHLTAAFQQDGSGGHTLAFAGVDTWKTSTGSAPTITTAAGTTEWFVFVKLGGTVYGFWLTESIATGGGLGVYGDGSDGALTVANGVTVTLAADKFYTTVLVQNGGVLKTAGFRICAKTSLTVDVGGVISDDGQAATLQSRGQSRSAGTLAGAGDGTGGNSTTVGGAGGTSSPSLGGAGGAGGAAGNGTAGGGAGPATALTASQGTMHTLPGAAMGWIISGAGGIVQPRGGAGGAAGGSDGTNFSGGGGAGGGIVIICAKAILNNGIIRAKGGAGGNATAGNSGGGGGGGGGWISIVTGSTTTAAASTGSIPGTGTLDVSGGAKGLKAGTGVDGSDGSTGTLRVLQN